MGNCMRPLPFRPRSVRDRGLREHVTPEMATYNYRDLYENVLRPKAPQWLALQKDSHLVRRPQTYAKTYARLMMLGRTRRLTLRLFPLLPFITE